MSAHPLTVRLLPERRLRSRAARGNDVAFAAVYERHHQALYRYCRSIVQDDQDAQDALQSAFTRAFAALQTEERDFDLRPWLFRIAHNEAITVLRQRRGTTVLDDDAQAAGALEDRVAEREELRLLRADLADLPERQRAALVLRELNGLSHEEIGRVLDLSPSGVKQALFDARTALWNARDGRALACDDVRRKLSDGDGRVLRGRGVRAHLRSCVICQGFRAELALARNGCACSRRRCPPPARRRSSRRCWVGRRPSCSPASRSRAAGRRSSRCRPIRPARPRARAPTSNARRRPPRPAAADLGAVPRPCGRVVRVSRGRPPERAAPIAATERPRRRGRGGERNTSAPAPTHTPAPSHTTAAEKPSGTRSAAETAPAATPVEAPATSTPAAGRGQDEPTPRGTDRPESETPPGQAKKQQPKPAKTNPGKAVGRPRTRRRRRPRRARTTGTPAATATERRLRRERERGRQRTRQRERRTTGAGGGPGQQRQRSRSHRRQRRERQRRRRRGRQRQRGRKRERQRRRATRSPTLRANPASQTDPEVEPHASSDSPGADDRQARLTSGCRGACRGGGAGGARKWPCAAGHGHSRDASAGAGRLAVAATVRPAIGLRSDPEASEAALGHP